VIGWAVIGGIFLSIIAAACGGKVKTTVDATTLGILKLFLGGIFIVFVVLLPRFLLAES
jgi:hypothetical protein